MRRERRKIEQMKMAARAMHKLWWFREARGRKGKKKMVEEWNQLYPGAPVSMAGLRALDRAEKKHGRRCL